MKRDSQPAQDSTLSDVSEPNRPPHGLWARRVAVAIMVIAIATAAIGWLGVRSATKIATNDGYRLAVTYARVARAGLDVPLTIQVTAPAPIRESIVISISSGYFRMLEAPDFRPDPSVVSSDATTLYFTFAPPPAGNTMVIDYEASIQPSAQWGTSATIALRAGGVTRVSLPIRTALLP